MVTYKLEVVQHPVRARLSGFGTRRCPLDPPPILKLSLSNAKISSIDVSHLVVHADLWSADTTKPRNLVINPASVPNEPTSSSTSVISLKSPVYARNLVGSLVSPSYHLLNLEEEQGIYFVFPDLSIRTEGRFTLKFVLSDIMRIAENASAGILADCFSNPFTIYTSREFPGVDKSTLLTNYFAKQGVQVPTRRTSYNREEVEKEER
ncbi:hypothetical protein K7432_013921 [Basidiobolus ranarum]|uniref:Velvet domain-containing protein n=1 Tax=Basidiobolus ranarum TaxID=34480 RepID=A0ABR2VQM6_9FUNG